MSQGVQVYFDTGDGDCVGLGYWNQEKRSWTVRGRNPTRDILVAGTLRCIRPLAELLRQRRLIEKTIGHLRHAFENPEAQAAPACAVARKFGEARILGGTHTNPGWTYVFWETQKNSLVRTGALADWRTSGLATPAEGGSSASFPWAGPNRLARWGVAAAGG